MFRECYFEYAGQSSQRYNLMLCYVSTDNTNFDSGGKFDLLTDNIPLNYDTYIYGKNYSEQPLEFDVEMIGTQHPISLEDMIEIKNWLFDQDGWKTFKCLDDRRQYALKCIFEPGEDIVDGSGYRGLRCKLRNASPFWYGDVITKTLTSSDISQLTLFDFPVPWSSGSSPTTAKYGAFEIDVPDNNRAVDGIYYPHVSAKFDLSNSRSGAGYNCHIANTECSSVSDASNVDYANTSQIAFKIDYINNIGGTIPKFDTVDISTRYGYVVSDKVPTHQFEFYNPYIDYLNLHNGKNILRLYEPSLYSSLTFTFEQLYRVGAF